MDYVPRRVLDHAFRRLSRRSLLDRLHGTRALAANRGLRYIDDAGRGRIIDIALKPWLLTSRQLLFFHRMMQLLAEAMLMLPRLRAARPELRTVMHIEPACEAWMQLVRHPRSRPMAVMGRLDSTAIYDQADWASAFRMLEPNAVGVGGVHYAPAACSVLLDMVGDVVTRALPGHPITATPDPRELLVEELRLVARRLGRGLKGVALIENADYTTGTDEFSHLAVFLTQRGINAVVADPRDLRLVRGSMRAKGVAVDLLYRDSELSEFVEMEATGRRLSTMRHAVQHGRLISGLTWEFDQKSAWEIFTDARYAQYFTPAQRRFFQHYVLWTRLVRDTKVSDLSGRMVDLPAYIRRHKDRLVLKPNALFGGEGVVIGTTVGRATWDRELRRALRGPRRYVVQDAAKLQHDTLPLLVNGQPRFENRATVSGFFFNSRGIGLIGRFSTNPVVNVSQGGGIVSALWVH